MAKKLVLKKANLDDHPQQVEWRCEDCGWVGRASGPRLDPNKPPGEIKGEFKKHDCLDCKEVVVH